MSGGLGLQVGEAEKEKERQDWKRDHRFAPALDAAGVVSWPMLYTGGEIASVLSFRKCSGMRRKEKQRMAFYVKIDPPIHPSIQPSFQHME
ncbi:unnamed protein product [Pleuronectes platessa]|uniref:Uncharacterized protein n=1 Tax=Pleuronectes platessa TaxID=8262 RepID=A0A9N7W1E8_PLEPL|nr:unnamed protein product [Pleuronectes platessa]